MSFFTKNNFFLFILLLVATLCSRQATAQCTFTLYPGAPYYCLSSTPTIYAVEDTVSLTYQIPGWYPANWTIHSPSGYPIAPVYHSLILTLALDSPGMYVVTMLDSVNGVPCTQTDSFFVVDNPTVKGHISENGSICYPTTACWIDSSTSPNSSSLSYFADWGNGIPDTSLCFTYDTPGYYYFLLTVTDSLGCYAMYSYQNAFHIGGPVMTITANSPGACVCDSVSFTVTSWNTNVLTWISGGGSPDTIYNDTIVRGTEANPTITTFTAQYCNTGYISPTVIGTDDTLNCPMALTLSVPVVIDSPLNQPAITENGFVLSAEIFTPDSPSYEWVWEGAIEGDSSTLTATQNGGYVLAITNMCNSATSDTAYVTGVGIAEIKASVDISLHPNPATQMCYISGTGTGAATYDAVLTDITGQEVSHLFSGKKIGSTPVGFPVAGYDKGVYLLRLTDDQGGVIVKKLVVE